MAAEERGIEWKVGALVILSLVLLGVLVLVMGGISLAHGWRVYVDFTNPGAIQTGAAV
jgi:ABC-type transporter Mla subunit MlaD